MLGEILRGGLRTREVPLPIRLADLEPDFFDPAMQGFKAPALLIANDGDAEWANQRNGSHCVDVRFHAMIPKGVERFSIPAKRRPCRANGITVGWCSSNPRPETWQGKFVLKSLGEILRSYASKIRPPYLPSSRIGVL